MPERHVAIHGHFYQPPRENPWLEAVETQDSAYPYHDWNARITHECYEPNATARILDEKERILGIVNNYAAISFNFGATLLSWLAASAPEVEHGVGDRMAAVDGHLVVGDVGHDHTVLLDAVAVGQPGVGHAAHRDLGVAHDELGVTSGCRSSASRSGGILGRIRE